MATEKFFVFNESGTLKRLKGRIVRFLDNEDPDNTDKVNIRASISVPASAEGLTPANNLSDVSSVATSRDNLGVPSDDELAEAMATKLDGLTLYFSTDDYIEIADDAKLSFVSATDDLPMSLSAWIKPDSLSSFPILSKYGNSGSMEWIFQVYGSGYVRLYLCNSSDGVHAAVSTTATLTLGEWVHVCATYGGSGPNGATAFASADSEMNIYINGKLQVTNSDITAYTGMINTTQPLYIGRFSSVYAEGHLRDVQIFNKKLSASEVAQLGKGNNLGFPDEWAGALGGVYTQDPTPSGEWAGSNGTDADEAGPIGGRSNVLKFTNDGTSAQHLIENTSIGTAVGKRYRIDFDYYIPSTNSNIDGLDINDRLSLGSIGTVASATLDAWTRFSAEYVATNTQVGINALDGGVATYQDAGADDVFYIDGLTISQIGKLADFRAEDYNESGGKLVDRSSNNFVGTNNGATFVGARRHISAATIDLKNLPTSSAGLSAGEVWSNSGVLTVV